MSRLDYATIIIVVICLVAAGFLLYKTYNMFTEEPEAPVQEDELAEEEPYYYDTTAYNNSFDTTAYEEEPPSTTYEEPSTNTTPQSYDASTIGEFMVLAGTFANSVNAEAQVQRLRNLGYSSARIEPFDRGTYDVVLVDRFSSYSDASALVQRLSNDGVDSYVKRQQGTARGTYKE